MQMNVFVNNGNYYIIESFPEVKIFLHNQILNGKLAYEFRKGENRNWKKWLGILGYYS